MIDISIEMEKYQKHAAVMQSREEKILRPFFLTENVSKINFISNWEEEFRSRRST